MSPLSPTGSFHLSRLARHCRDALRGSGSPSLLCVSLALGAVSSASADEDTATQRQRLDSIVVKGSRIDMDYDAAKPSLDKLTEPLVDTPQSITTISAEELQSRAITTLNDALRNVPGITLGAGETSWQGNNVYLRGFTTRDDMFADGQRDFGYYYRDPFNTESIEVLKGPSSILFGRGSTGGVINQVSKTPGLSPSLSGGLLLSTAQSRRATLDVNEPFAAELGGALRLNLMGDHTEIADRDTARSNRWGIAPSLALGLGTPTRLTLSYLHQVDNDVPDYGIPWRGAAPASVDRNNYYGFASDYLKTNVNVVTARLEHDFSDSLSVASQLRYSHDQRSFRYTEAVVPAGTSPLIRSEDVTVSRNEFQGLSTDAFVQDQTDLSWRFATGSLRHTLVSGFELGRETPNPTYDTNVGVPATNLASPQDFGYSTTASYVRLTADTVAKTAAAYALDTVDLTDHWQFMGGVRWDRFAVAYRSVGFTPAGAAAATTDLDRVDTGFSYRGALIYKPTVDSSFYLSYGTSFDPSAEGIESLISSGRAVAQANLNLDPEKSRSYELGSKWSILSGRVLLTGALFRLEMTNVRVPDPSIPGFNMLGGDQRVDGAEIDAVGRITDTVKLRVGYTYLDSETTHSTPGGPLQGQPLALTARNTFALFAEYRPIEPLEFGFGSSATSRHLGQNTAAQYEVAPGYVIFDAFAKYDFTPHIEAQINVRNIGNKYYDDQLHPFHVIPGEGRVALFGINVKF